MDIDEIHTFAEQAVKATGHRYTDGKRRLVTALHELKLTTIPNLLEHDSGLAQSSVYRQLVELHTAGVTHCIGRVGIHAHWGLVAELKRCEACGHPLGVV